MSPSGMTGTGSSYYPVRNRYGELTLVQILVFTCILAFLFLLDITTTQVILGMGGVELNPLMAGMVTFPVLHIILKCGILMMVIPVAVIAEERVRGAGIALYAVLIVMYTVVNINNFSVLIPHVVRAFTG